MRTPDPALQDRRRREILEAAAKCFVRYGFHQTTMDQICAAAGLSPGAVYRYFTSKHAIIESIANQERTEIADFFKRLHDAPDFVDGLVAFTEKFVFASVKSDDARLGIEIMAEASRNPHVSRLIARHGKEAKKLFVQILRKARARGDIDSSLKPEPVAELLLALIEGIMGRASYSPRYDGRSLARSFAILVARFLRPPAMAKRRSR